MWNEVKEGGAKSAKGSSNKLILGRGCDPVMAQQSASILPPLLGGARILAFTDDKAFFRELESMAKGEKEKPDVVFFAPGACRWSAARRPIPGGIPGTSHGWSLEQYYEHVQEVLGPQIPIVSTAHEVEIVPLLRKALGLP